MLCYRGIVVDVIAYEQKDRRMISYKIFYRDVPNKWGKDSTCRFSGWFLFGRIQLYTRQDTYYE